MRVLVGPNGDVDANDPQRVARAQGQCFEEVLVLPKITDPRTAAATVVLFVMPSPLSMPDADASAQMGGLSDVALAYESVPMPLRPLLVFMELGDGSPQTACSEGEESSKKFDLVLPDTVNPFLPDNVQGVFLDLVQRVYARLKACDSMDEDELLCSTPVGAVSPLPWTHGGVAPRIPPMHRLKDDSLSPSGARPAMFPIAEANGAPE
jgi:hypothetical protein